MNPFQSYSPQTQRVIQSVQDYGNFMIRYQEVRQRDRIQLAVRQGTVREWFFTEYCYSVHYTSEQDVCYQAVSAFLDQVNWDVVQGLLVGYLNLFQERVA
jgi:hypothetical protein